MINKELAKHQGLTDDDLQNLDKVYKKLDDVLTNPLNYDNPVLSIEDLEYELQEIWKFELNSAYHRYWLEISGCTCPKLDNYDIIGTGRVIISGNCPWHSLGEVNV